MALDPVPVDSPRAKRVLVVDDSPTARAYLSALVSALGFEIVAAAGDVAEAERLARSERPDLVLSDVQLPDGDGMELTRRVLAERGVPIVLITGHDPGRPELAFRALEAGALDLLPKPPARSHPSYPAYLKRFDRTLRALAAVPVVRRRASIWPAEPGPAAELRLAQPPIVAIGSSTGGPVLVADLLRALATRRYSFALVAQHIVPDFLGSFSAWLAQYTGRPIRRAVDGERPLPGGIYVVPGSHHLTVTGAGTFRLAATTGSGAEHVPSIDALFSSLAAYQPRDTIAILLTGMGHDGAAGMAALRQAGALTVAQAPATAAVDSMPKSAISRKAAAQILTPAEIAALLLRLPPAAIRPLQPQ